MKKTWRLHRPLTKCNCVQIGEAGEAFVRGLPVQSVDIFPQVVLKDVQYGFTQKFSVADACIAQGRLYHAFWQYGDHFVPSSMSHIDTFVMFDALTAKLPFGEQLVGDNFIPGGVFVRKGTVRHAPWRQAGPSYSWSKHQLFLMQEGDRVVCVTHERKDGESVFTTVTLARHSQVLTMRYPTPSEIAVLKEEQQLWSDDWQRAQDIYNPHL